MAYNFQDPIKSLLERIVLGQDIILPELERDPSPSNIALRGSKEIKNFYGLNINYGDISPLDLQGTARHQMGELNGELVRELERDDQALYRTLEQEIYKNFDEKQEAEFYTKLAEQVPVPKDASQELKAAIGLSQQAAVFRRLSEGKPEDARNVLKQNYGVDPNTLQGLGAAKGYLVAKYGPDAEVMQVMRRLSERSREEAKSLLAKEEENLYEKIKESPEGKLAAAVAMYRMQESQKNSS